MITKYEVIKEIIRNDNLYDIFQLARNEEVVANDTILYGETYHLRKVAKYVKKYGLSIIEEIVRDFYVRESDH